MFRWFAHLDQLLRGETTRAESLRDGRIDVAAGGLAVLIVVLGMLYGLCMGSYSVLKGSTAADVAASSRYMQLLATSIKVPALFYLTLLVTFPSLYVFNALVGSRLTLVNVLRLLIASLAVNLAVLASLGPIVLFFSASTKSYAFILLLNVIAFSISGFLGLTFLLQTLHRLTTPIWADDWSMKKYPSSKPLPEFGAAPEYSAGESGDTVRESTLDDEPNALELPAGQALGRHTRLVFGCWVVVFSLVGAQMGWVLRPFVGSPNLPFTWFRERESNFFEAVLNAIRALLTTGG